MLFSYIEVDFLYDTYPQIYIEGAELNKKAFFLLRQGL